MHIDHLGAQALAASAAQEAMDARAQDVAAAARKQRLNLQRLARLNAQNPDLEVTEEIEGDGEEAKEEESSGGGLNAKA
jgi:hypothetical protein